MRTRVLTLGVSLCALAAAAAAPSAAPLAPAAQAAPQTACATQEIRQDEGSRQE